MKKLFENLCQGLWLVLSVLPIVTLLIPIIRIRSMDDIGISSDVPYNGFAIVRYKLEHTFMQTDEHLIIKNDIILTMLTVFIILQVLIGISFLAFWIAEFVKKRWKDRLVLKGKAVLTIGYVITAVMIQILAKRCIANQSPGQYGFFSAQAYQQNANLYGFGKMESKINILASIYVVIFYVILLVSYKKRNNVHTK